MEKEKYSKDIVKYNKECRRFLEYIKQYIIKNEVNILYINRKENIIKYGKIEENTKINENTINMINENNLKDIYIKIKKEFQDNFINGIKKTYGEGWSLNPIINNNTLIDINSDNIQDKKWFCKEAAKIRKLRKK